MNTLVLSIGILLISCQLSSSFLPPVLDDILGNVKLPKLPLPKVPKLPLPEIPKLPLPDLGDLNIDDIIFDGPLDDILPIITNEKCRICAFNGQCYKTFTNNHALFQQNEIVDPKFIHVSVGPCENYKCYLPICDNDVPEDNPICGYDENTDCYKTFGGDEQLEKHNEQFGTDFENEHNGACRPNEIPKC